MDDYYKSTSLISIFKTIDVDNQIFSLNDLSARKTNNCLKSFSDAFSKMLQKNGINNKVIIPLISYFAIAMLFDANVILTRKDNSFHLNIPHKFGEDAENFGIELLICGENLKLKVSKE